MTDIVFADRNLAQHKHAPTWQVFLALLVWERRAFQRGYMRREFYFVFER